MDYYIHDILCEDGKRGRAWWKRRNCTDFTATKLSKTSKKKKKQGAKAVTSKYWDITMVF